MIQSVLLFGTRCDFADIVADRLQRSGYEIRARIVPGIGRSFEPFEEVRNAPAPTQHRILPVAGRSLEASRHPTIIAHDLGSTELEHRLASLDADASVVCCYPDRLPLTLVETARLGGLNVHPSLLPAYRGPEPLFWVYRNGETTTGVTVHKVTNALDAGPIFAQRSIDLPVGKRGDELWIESARLGATLLLDSLEQLANALQGSEQSREDSNYQTWPSLEDLVVRPEEWEAWRVHHFVAGVVPLGYTPLLIRESKSFSVRESGGIVDACHTHPTVEDERFQPVHCREGIVRLMLDQPIS